MTPITQRQLDVTTCDTPNCKHDHSKIYLIPNCHPNAGLRALYVKATGNLELQCRRCNSDVVTIAVAHGATPS